MRRAASTSDARRRRPWRCTGLVAALLALVACSPGLDSRREELHVFGSSAQLEIRGGRPADVQAALASVSEMLNQREREWHAWEPSDVTRINAAFAAGLAAEAPASVLDLVARAKPLAEASEGLFDPAIGALIGSWGFHTSSFPVLTPAPSTEFLADWQAQRPRIGDVVARGNQLSAANPRTQLDFGAMAEGVAAESVIEILRRHGIEHALMSLGGDLLALGDGGRRGWNVGIRDPFGGMLGSIELRDGEGLFSTGNYSRFRETTAGERWPHILDPRTAYPAKGAAAVVVLHPDPVLADAGATALFVAGPAGFEQLARRLGVGCALMVTQENELLVSIAMAERASLLRTSVPLGEPLDLGRDCRGG